MVNRNLISGLDLNEQDWDDEIQNVLGGGDFSQKIVEGKEITPNEIIEGKIVRIEKEFVIVDVGYKSEGQIPIS